MEKRDTLPESVQNPAKVVEVVVTGDAEIVGKKDILLESVPIPRKKVMCPAFLATLDNMLTIITIQNV